MAPMDPSKLMIASIASQQLGNKQDVEPSDQVEGSADAGSVSGALSALGQSTGIAGNTASSQDLHASGEGLGSREVQQVSPGATMLDTAKGAGQGAMMGSAFGAPGAAIGAGVGGLASLLGSIFK
jgi:hypothetical protein